MEFINVYKVICNQCAKPFYELHNGLATCPHCKKDSGNVLCKETSTYGIEVNPLTGDVYISGSDVGKEFLS